MLIMTVNMPPTIEPYCVEMLSRFFGFVECWHMLKMVSTRARGARVRHAVAFALLVLSGMQ